MIIELWWKVFILAGITAVVSKIFGASMNGIGIFFYSAIGWLVLLVLIIVVSQMWEDRKKKGGEHEEREKS